MRMSTTCNCTCKSSSSKSILRQTKLWQMPHLKSWATLMVCWTRAGSSSIVLRHVSIEEKRCTVDRMQQCDQNFSVQGIRLENCPDLHNKELHNLASSCTLHLLHLDTSFIMTNDPEMWNDAPVYIQNKWVVESLKVANDTAKCSMLYSTNVRF